MDTAMIEEVASMASLLYTPEDIAIVLGLESSDVEGWLMDRDSDFYKAYYSAYYKTDIEVRMSVLSLAKRGSSPAQMMAAKLLDKTAMQRFYE